MGRERTLRDAKRGTAEAMQQTSEQSARTHKGMADMALAHCGPSSTCW